MKTSSCFLDWLALNSDIISTPIIAYATNVARVTAHSLLAFSDVDTLPLFRKMYLLAGLMQKFPLLFCIFYCSLTAVLFCRTKGDQKALLSLCSLGSWQIISIFAWVPLLSVRRLYRLMQWKPIFVVEVTFILVAQDGNSVSMEVHSGSFPSV